MCVFFVLLLGLSAGYAAFSSNISLNAKGNIYNKGDLCYKTSDNGDGTVTITDYDETCGSEVNIPSKIKGKTVTKIGDTEYNVSKVFNSKGLTKVVIPDTVISIGDYAFWGNSISSLDLGEGVVEIGMEAFVWNKLTSITFPQSLKKISYSAFRSNNLTLLPNLDNISYDGVVFSDNNLTGDDVFVYGKNSDGVIDNSILNSYGGCDAGDITIPDSVKTIQEYAFRGVSADSINLIRVETIESIAFFQTNASIINISNTIKEIPSDAVTQSPNIKTINIDRKEGAIEGAPWGAVNANVNWIGDN